ncbi:MAG: hypothetical protein AAGF83_06330, partial [Cyanobacteria bacterium P01_G01_bin.67]
AGMIEEDLLLFLFSRDTSPKPFAMRNPDYSMDSNSILQLHFSCAYPAYVSENRHITIQK